MSTKNVPIVDTIGTFLIDIIIIIQKVLAFFGDPQESQDLLDYLFFITGNLFLIN